MAKLGTILITGATGHQGGAVANELLGRGHKIVAMTRHPESEKAKALEKRGAKVIKGDLDAAYAYLSDGSKATTPLDVYKSKIRPGSWRQAKVEKVECEAEVCRVEMQITFDHKLMKGIQGRKPDKKGQ